MFKLSKTHKASPSFEHLKNIDRIRLYATFQHLNAPYYNY